MPLQDLERPASESAWPRALSLPHAVQDVVGDRSDVLETLAQRWEAQLHGAEAIEERPVEATDAHQLPERHRGRGEEANARPTIADRREQPSLQLLGQALDRVEVQRGVLRLRREPRDPA